MADFQIAGAFADIITFYGSVHIKGNFLPRISAKKTGNDMCYSLSESK